MIPAGWQEVRLGDICRLSAAPAKKPDGARYVILDMGSVARDGSLLAHKRTDGQADLLDVGDLVMPKDDIGGGQIIGKVVVVSESDRYVLGDHVYRLRLSRGCPAFVRYAINSHGVNASLRSKVVGSAQLGLGRKAVLQQMIPFPPVNEQEAIAEALSDADAAIEALDALIAKKRDVKQAAMQQLLTGRTRLPGFSGDWEEDLVGSLFTFQRTTALSRAQLSEAGEVHYIHYGDIHSRWDTHLDLSRHSLPKVDSSLASAAAAVVDGDLVLADASEDLDGVGKAVEVVGIGNRQVISGLHTVLLRPRAGVFAPGFLGYVPSTPGFKLQARTLAAGLKVFGLSKTSLRQIVIRVPGAQEQATIALVLMDMDAEIEAPVCQGEVRHLV